jgi:hypothetical protein
LVDQQQRVATLAAALTTRVSPNAVIVSGEQSGAMRLYTAHEVVRWEALAAGEWPDVERRLASRGRDVWIVLDAWEEPLLRSKLGELALDWPPAIDAGDTHRTRAWHLADREKFRAGDRIVTERLR